MIWLAAAEGCSAVKEGCALGTRRYQISRTRKPQSYQKYHAIQRTPEKRERGGQNLRRSEVRKAQNSRRNQEWLFSSNRSPFCFHCIYASYIFPGPFVMNSAPYNSSFNPIAQPQAPSCSRSGQERVTERCVWGSGGVRLHLHFNLETLDYL